MTRDAVQSAEDPMRALRNLLEERQVAKTKRKVGAESAKLRQRAEERVAKFAKTAASASGTDTRRLIHELEVHQVELELQNEELRQARAEIEANYNELYDFAPVGYFTLGRLGDIKKANLTGAGMLGQPRNEVLGRRLASFLAPDSLPYFDDLLSRVRARHDKQTCMITLMKGGVTPVFAHIEVTGLDQDAGCRAVVVDITTAEQARLALRDSEQHLKLAMAASHIGVWECEYATGDVYWSPECFKISGIASLSPTLDTVAQLLHPEDAPRIRSIVGQALGDGTEQSIECRIIRPDGQVVWIAARGQLQCDIAGKPTRVIGNVQDITERKRANRDASPGPA